MIRTIYLTLLLLLTIAVFGQNDGYILVSDIVTDTLWGELDLANGLKRQNTVSFRKKAGEEFTVYGPGVIIGYGSDRSGHYMSSNFDPALEQIFIDNLSFVRRITAGKISVFRYDKKVRLFVGAAAGFETTTNYIAGNEEGYKLYTRESFISEIKKDKQFNDKLDFVFNDYDVAYFFARRAEREGGEVEILSLKKWKDKKFHPYVEFGGFRNTWVTDFDIFSYTELVPGNRLEFGAGIQRKIGNEFWVKGGLHYTAYKNSGEIQSVAGPSFANSGEVVVAENTVEATYLGVNLGGGYNFLNLKNGAFYATLRLGMGLVVSEKIELQTFMQRETDDNRREYFAGPFDFRPTQNRDPRLYLPNDMIGVGAGAGFSMQVADRLTPFVEMRAQLNTNAGRKYSYTEFGLAAGVVF